MAVKQVSKTQYIHIYVAIYFSLNIIQICKFFNVKNCTQKEKLLQSQKYVLLLIIVNDCQFKIVQMTTIDYAKKKKTTQMQKKN